MEKIKFNLQDVDEEVEFFVLEHTKINGSDYILVTDSEEGDATALILKDLSEVEDEDALYQVVEDDEELEYLLKIFEEILEDVDIE